MKYIIKSSLILIIMTVITGIIYPLTITAVAQIFVHDKANGSIIEIDNQKVGSKIVGQNFTEANYFWSRPSATADYPYNGNKSAGSNSSPTGEDFNKIINERIELYKEYDNVNEIPVDLITASGSGLDPHISLLGAKYQVNRVAKYSGISEEKLIELIEKNTEKKNMGIFGEEIVNVLELNIDLEKLK